MSKDEKVILLAELQQCSIQTIFLMVLGSIMLGIFLKLYNFPKVYYEDLQINIQREIDGSNGS